MLKTTPMNLTQVSEIAYRGLTAPWRVLPDFLIIGAQKAGTTSLYSYLEQHPCVTSAFRKELNFFDIGFQRGNLWYQGYFPTQLHQSQVRKQHGNRAVTGEACPTYLFHPLSAQRVAATVPQAKLIVLLRNPVTRAYSHYNHTKVRGNEPLSFEDAIAVERDRMAPELEKIKSQKNYSCFNFRIHSYLSRGIYVEQLQEWFKFFPREQFLIIKSEDFTANPREIFQQVLKFLDLPPWDLTDYKAYHSGAYSAKLNEQTKHQLIEYFAPYNQQLSELIGADFTW
jgi:hypothetical protein